MKVFISWSGILSHNVALVLGDWLESVIQTIKCFVSSEAIDKGSRWFPEISKELETSKFGIICTTRENMDAPWILFEAGALSKIVDRSQVCPLLIDITPTDLTGPLAQFQCTHPLQDKDEMLKLIKTINSKMGDGALDMDKVEKSFNQWWVKYIEDINKILQENEIAGKVSVSPRDQKEILDEILNLCRTIAQNIPDKGSYVDIISRLVGSIEQPRKYSSTGLASMDSTSHYPVGFSSSSATPNLRGWQLIPPNSDGLAIDLTPLKKEDDNK